MKFYNGGSIRLTSLARKKIAVLGYGSQGRAQAQNLNDSGLDVVVGLRHQSPSFRTARRDGVHAVDIKEVVKGADLVCFLLPDEHQQAVYEADVVCTLKPGMALVFAHGFNIFFQKIVPPKGIDIFMVAPKGPGPRVRASYLTGEGTPSIMAIYQDETGRAKQLALAYAKGIGCSRRGIFETTFEQETVSDLFGEQTVLCGGVVELMKSAFDTLVKAGIPPEAAYFECFHELKFIVDLLHEGGLHGMLKAVSPTAGYGGMTRGKRLINASVRKELRKILQEIKSGAFAEEWLRETRRGAKRFHKMIRAARDERVERWGKKIRKQIGY